jgi:hypothetical protein
MVSVSRKAKASLRDLLEPDARCIALEGFRPPMRREVDRGSFHRLNDDLVRSFPSYFGVVVPVEQLDER